MERKSDKVRRLVAGHDYRHALAIAKGFRLGIAEEDWKQMTRAHECIENPAFYRSIGMDPSKEVEKGLSILKRPYGRESRKTRAERPAKP